MSKRSVPGAPHRVSWTARAIRDADEIAKYIAEQDVKAAERVINTLFDGAEKLGDTPEIGRVVPEFKRDDVRQIVRLGFRIIYRIGPADVWIVTVLRGARRLPSDVDADETTDRSK